MSMLSPTSRRIRDEGPISLEEACQYVPGFRGECAGTGTLLRYCLQGLHGIKLESCRIGGKRRTSYEAIVRFLAATR